MRPSQEPFRKTAMVYRSEKFICIEPVSGANILMYLEDDETYRVYLEPDATVEVLGQTLLAALARSRSVQDKAFFDRDRATRAHANWQKDFMRRYGYKTKRDAYKNLDWCRAQVIDGKILIQPHRRLKVDAWKYLPPDSTVVIPATEDARAVGEALRLALDRCE